MVLFISNSSERAPKCGLWRDWRWAGLVASVILGSYMAVNIVIDPFGVGWVSFYPDLPRKLIARSADPIRWEITEVVNIEKTQKQQASIALFGDSRTRSLSGGWTRDRRVFQEEGDAVLDLSIAGGKWAETLAVLERELPRLSSVKSILIGVPLDRLIEVEAQTGWRNDPYQLAMNPIVYAINMQTSRVSWKVWQSRHKKEETLAKARPSPDDAVQRLAWGLNEIHQDIAAVNIERLEAVLFSPLRSRLQVLKQGDSQREVRVYFFLPPARQETVDFIDSDYRELYDRCIDGLQALGTVLDLTQSPPGVTYEFIHGDPHHLTWTHASVLWRWIYVNHMADVMPPARPAASATPSAPVSQPGSD